MGGPQDDSILTGFVDSGTSSGDSEEVGSGPEPPGDLEGDSGNDSVLVDSAGDKGSYTETPSAGLQPAEENQYTPRRLFDPMTPDKYGGFDL